MAVESNVILSEAKDPHLPDRALFQDDEDSSLRSE